MKFECPFCGLSWESTDIFPKHPEIEECELSLLSFTQRQWEMRPGRLNNVSEAPNLENPGEPPIGSAMLWKAQFEIMRDLAFRLIERL